MAAAREAERAPHQLELDGELGSIEAGHRLGDRRLGEHGGERAELGARGSEAPTRAINVDNVVSAANGTRPTRHS